MNQYRYDVFCNEDGGTDAQISRRIMDGEFLLVQSKKYLDSVEQMLTGLDHLGIIIVNLGNTSKMPIGPWLVSVLRK